MERDTVRPAGGWNDPLRQEGRKALARTVVNGAIATADAIPGIGDAFSVAADVAKIAHRTAQRLSRVPGLRKLAEHTGVVDLTPDVSATLAVGTELAEPLLLGGVPTHAVEAGMQYFLYDKARIKAGREARQAHQRQQRPGR